MKNRNSTIKYGSQSKVMAIAIALLLACVSFLAVATNAFMPKVSRALALDMKAAGDSFLDYANSYTGTVTAGLEQVTMDALFKQVYNSSDSSKLNPGIIAPIEGGAAAKYQNTPYNYEVTISSADELTLYSYLCAGFPYLELGTITESNAIVATFFKNANVRLANHIDFANGNGRFITNASGGATVKTITNGTAVSGTPSSNGVYGGYAGGVEARVAFLPINEFGGVFTGGGYDIANLVMVRNRSAVFGGKAGGDASTDPGFNDAFFASVTTSGRVSNFGLSNASYIFAKNHTNSIDISRTEASLANYNRVSGMVGINKGSVSNVYASSVRFAADSTAYGASTTIKTIGSGNVANANEFVTDRAVVYTTNALTGATTIMPSAETVTETDTAGAKKWYSTKYGDRFNNSYMISAAGGYRLSGLDGVSYGTVDGIFTQEYDVHSVADFLENATAYREGFAIYNYTNSTLGTSDIGNGLVYVRITKSLDFSNIGRYGFYPMIALGGAPNYILYGGAINASNKAGAPINKVVNGASVPDYTARATIYKLPLHNYADGLKNNGADTFRSYGMFAHFGAGQVRPLSLYNINFIKCDINVVNAVATSSATNLKSTITNAATVAGYTFRTVDLRSVSTNSRIMATSGDNTIDSNRFAGFVASFDNISGTAIDGKGQELTFKSRFEGLVFTGELFQGSRYTAVTNASPGYNRFATGGIVGFMDNSTISSSNAKSNYFFKDIYVGGNITGFKSLGKLDNKGTEPVNSIGGVVGYGNITRGGTVSGVENFYVEATLLGSDNTLTTSAVLKHPTNIGGLIGEQIINGLTTSLIFDNASGTSVIKSAITVNTNPGANGAQESSPYNAGGIVGFAKSLTVTGSAVNPILSANYFNSITVLHNSTVSSAELNIGTLAGRADEVKLSHINNVASLNVNGRLSLLAVGGLVGLIDNVATEISIDNVTSSGNITANVSGATTVRSAGLINVEKSKTISFSNSSVSGVMQVTANSNNTHVSGLANISQGEATFTACTTASTTKIDVTVSGGKTNVAGVASFIGTATANGIFDNIITEGSIILTSTGAQLATMVSGIVAVAKENVGKFIVNNSKNEANILASTLLTQADPSNFTGIASKGIIYNTENHGAISLTDTSSAYHLEVGVYGIAAFGTIASCKNYGALSVKGASSNGNRKIYLSGLVGDTESQIVDGYAYTLGSSTNHASGTLTATSTGAASVFIGGVGVTSPDVYSSYNYANISADGGTGAVTIGGLLAHMPNGAKNTYKVYSANYGNLTVNNYTSTVHMGGLLGSATSIDGASINTAVSQSFNHGDLTSTNCTGNVTVGGIVGNAIGGINISDAISSANINISGGNVVVGGIAGSINGSTANTFKIDNVIATKGVSLTASGTGIAGGVIGELSLNGHTVQLYNLVSGGAVTGKTVAGGVIGNIKNSVTVSGAVTNYSIKSALNYGNVLAVGGIAGGIIGTLGDSGATQYSAVTLDGAVAYGNITGNTASNNSGGIVGAKNQGGTLSLSNAVSYAVTNSNFGIIGASVGSAATLNMVVFVSDGASKTIAPVLGTQTNVYIVNSSNTDSISLATLYGSNFVLAPGANEQAYYGKANTEVPTLVWSEQPFKTASGYRSGAISDTVTATSQKNVFALTTTGGRRQGMYLGNFDKSKITGSDSAKIASLKAEIDTLKQIDYSRDTFDFSLDTVMNNGSRIPLILSDDQKVGDRNRDLPTAGYVGNNTYITTIQPTSEYFLANSGATFVLDGSKIVLKEPSNFTGVFSNNAKNTGLTHVSSETDFDFNHIPGNPYTIATYKTMVYQGADLSATLTGDALTAWKEMYTQEYKFIIMYYDSNPSFMLSESPDFTALSLENISDIAAAPKNTISLIDGVTSGNEISYTAKTTADGNLSAAWVGSKLTAIFTVSGFEQSYVETKLTTQLYKKNTSGAFEVFANANQSYLTLKITYEHFQSTTIDPLLPPVATGRVKVELTITDRLLLTEIESGTYKLSLSLPLSTETMFVRSVIFDKEASGDVFLHLANDTLVTGTNDINLQLSDISNPYGNTKNYAYKADLNVNTLEADGKRKFSHNRVLVNEAAAYQYSAYYGALPAFNKTNLSTLAIFNSEYKFGNKATVSAPIVTINRLDDGRQLGFTYAFTITAENGNVGEYSYTYTYEEQNRPPPIRRNYTDDTGTEITSNVEVSRNGSRKINVNYGGYANLTGAIDPIAISTIDIYLKWNASQLAPEKVGYFDGTSVIKLTTINMRLPIVKAISNTVAQITIESNTTGGEYTFVNNYVYRYTAYTADSPEGTPKLPAYVSVKDTNGVALTQLKLEPYTLTGHNIIIQKKDSRAAYLRELTFTSNLPEGGTLKGRSATGNLAEIATFQATEETVQSKKQAKASIGYANSYVNAETENYFSADRINNFRVEVNFPAALAAGLSDYTTFVMLTLRGHVGSVAQNTLYNDDFTTVYSVDGSNETPLAKTTYYMLDGNGVPLVDADTGEQIVDYQTIEFFLPESSAVNLRVRAGNTLYYNDYTFISTGPLKNKNFNITVNAPDTLANQNIVVALKMETEDKAKPGSYLTLKSNNFLFRTNNGTGFYDAPLVDDVYTKTYLNTNNTAGRYRLEIISGDKGISAKITSITIVVGSPDNLIFTKGNDFFEAKSEEVLTLQIVIDLMGVLNPPWGDRA